jgi:hypothetical protein
VTRLLCLLSALLALGPAGCGSLPALVPANDPAACPAIFLEGRWQMVHAIEAAYPDGTHGLLVGVTVFSSQDRVLDCILMTAEGFVLFEAADAGRVQVRRAVPPFDRPGFAAGLLADVRLVLLAPKGTPTAGRTADGQTVCRYRSAGGGTTDIAAEPEGWRLTCFDANGRRKRTAIMQAPAAGGAPERITLQAHGPAAYRLSLNLISATRLDSENAAGRSLKDPR